MIIFVVHSVKLPLTKKLLNLDVQTSLIIVRPSLAITLSLFLCFGSSREREEIQL